MVAYKILLFALLSAAAAEKKIELQDIEDDNLKSEKEKDEEKAEGRAQVSAITGPGLLPIEVLKSDFLRYFNGENQIHQPRYVQQYAVSEQPEKPTPKPQYGPPTVQQAYGYLSNIPMQIYLVPQYYNDVDQAQSGVQFAQPVNRVAAYQTQEPVQPQSNYIEVPTYVTPGKGYVQPYSSPVTYVSFVQPTVSPQATVTPVLTYQMPVVQYPTAIAAPPLKNYYQNQNYESNSVDDGEEGKHYPAQTEVSYPKEYPRYYNSRAPVNEEYRSPASELPPPNPLLLKAPPAHLAHLPKALPMYRPLTKSVYASGGGFVPNTFTPRPSDFSGYKRRPNSLLDSYIPSSLQLEYLKRGIIKDPFNAYEALSSARQLQSHSHIYPRHYERGFLPNQMYHTAAGGVTFGHHKRTAKPDKA
ncbi:adhesive plaque matrix protein-like [Aricia agestis]|uniref:adhesive plaque matrix protein-like n=1 Tax=Aricia agestis TaxID=91739 RepID=UPI001C20475C|nr:adhesive plaque matrix protein-like [Aricia agestis]